LNRTHAVDFFSNHDLLGLFSWLSRNGDRVDSVHVKTAGGETVSGAVVQVTANYVALSYGDQLSEMPFSGTVVPLTAVSSVDFHLKGSNGTAHPGGVRPHASPRADMA
jgi:hypothetical protein